MCVCVCVCARARAYVRVCVHVVFVCAQACIETNTNVIVCATCAYMTQFGKHDIHEHISISYMLRDCWCPVPTAGIK